MHHDVTFNIGFCQSVFTSRICDMLCGLLQLIIVSTGEHPEYFWPHFEKQDGHHRRFLTFSKDFCLPSRAKNIIDRDLKFKDMFLVTKC